MSQSVAVVITADDEVEPIRFENVIKGIVECTEDVTVKPDGQSFVTWNICNKYYEAAVDICAIKDKSLMDQKFSDELEAVVVLFDSEKNAGGLKCVESWCSYFDVWSPAIRLVVCERCSSDPNCSKYISREAAQLWCLEHDFELVEMNPDLEDYDEDEDYGMVRIRKALNAHIWPQMKLKSSEKQCDKEKGASNEAVNLDSISNDIESKIDAMLSSLNDDEQDEEDFEALFQKMHAFKQTSESLPHDSRKEHAEKVVLAFWKALNGDKEEIDGSPENG